MSLSAHERQELDSIEGEIAGSSPALASLFATFGRLTAGEEVPAREQIRAGRRPRPDFAPARPGLPPARRRTRPANCSLRGDDNGEGNKRARDTGLLVLGTAGGRTAGECCLLQGRARRRSSPVSRGD